MELLFNGSIRNRRENRLVDFSVARLELKHIDLLLEFQKMILGSVERNDLFAGLTIEEFNRILGGRGAAVGAFVKDEIIAFYAIMFPHGDEDNLALDLGLPKEDYAKVAHLEGAGVHPDYRGNSLQKTLTGICLKEAAKLRDIKYLCATVSPYNYPSIDHIFAAGLYIKGLKEKYGRMLRYVCIKHTQKELDTDKNSIVEVDSREIDTQLKLLENGYVGMGLVRSDEGGFISYARLKQ